MAFKRSAVRSRLSPPQKLRNLWISEFFSFVLYIKKFCFSPLIFEGRNFLTQILPNLDPNDNMTQWTHWYRTSQRYQFIHFINIFTIDKCIAETCHRIFAYGFLDMQVMLRHIDIRMANDTLNGFNVHAKAL